MDALKKSMTAKGQAKVRDTVRRRMGKEPSEKLARAPKRPSPQQVTDGQFTKGWDG